MEIWVAFINVFKDILVTLIKIFVPINKAKKRKKGKSVSFYKGVEEKVKNPFIPSDVDIENLNIDDEDYIESIATYLASDRPIEDIKIDKERKQ